MIARAPNVPKEGFRTDFKRPSARPHSTDLCAFTNTRHASSPLPGGEARMTMP